MRKNTFLTCMFLVLGTTSLLSSKELSPKEKNIVDHALNFTKDKNEILIDQYNVKMTRDKLLCLQDGVWLNDEVINFYLRKLIDKKRTASAKKTKCLFLSTFFYFKLVQQLRRFDYDGVKRWTRKVNFFSYDKIIIPINTGYYEKIKGTNKAEFKGTHWVLVVINLRDKKFEYYDSMFSELRGKKILEKMRRYVKAESLDKDEITHFDLSGFTDVLHREAPQQKNGTDCGVFTIKTAEHIIQDKQLSFTQKDMSYFRKKICFDIIMSDKSLVKNEIEQDDDLTVIHNEDGSIVIVIDDEEERENIMPLVIDLTSDDVDTKDLIDEAVIVDEEENVGDVVITGEKKPENLIIIDK